MKVQNAANYIDDQQEDTQERARSTPPQRSRGQFTYSRQNKRTTHHGGMHRRRARRWNW
ncbi:MAG: hypothetical protein WBF93_17420 [Pirellulales bacterium]